MTLHICDFNELLPTSALLKAWLTFRSISISAGIGVLHQHQNNQLLSPNKKLPASASYSMPYHADAERPNFITFEYGNVSGRYIKSKG